MTTHHDLHVLQEWFGRKDSAMRTEKGTAVHGTTHGIWGSTDMDEAFQLFEKLGLREGMRFCDLGSGDGRIAFVAALFCDATGIEGDPALHAIAQQARGELVGKIPSLQRCRLLQADYTSEDLSRFDVLFAFADHAWNKELEQALASRERPGIVVSHHDIFRPASLRRGPTVWIGQSPFYTYPIGKTR
jgi:SAM-dependent methyltransferase